MTNILSIVVQYILIWEVLLGFGTVIDTAMWCRQSRVTQDKGKKMATYDKIRTIKKLSGIDCSTMPVTEIEKLYKYVIAVSTLTMEL